MTVLGGLHDYPEPTTSLIAAQVQGKCVSV